MSETASQGRGSATLARSSALMASGTLVSRMLGLVRVLLLAGAVGLLSGPANAWSTANTLPNTVYLLLAGGILNVILVPSITRAMSQPDGGRAFTDRLLTLALLALAGIAVVFTAGAAVLTRLYAWTWDGEQFALAVSFAYLCLPQIFFYGLYTVLGQILNAQEKFGYYMWAPVANNIVAIAGILVFRTLYPEAADLGPGAWTAEMVWLLGGTATLGVVTQALVLMVPVWRSGFRYRPRWGFRGVGLGTASRMAIWMLGVVGVSQAGMWLSTNVLNRASDIDELAAGKIVYENAFLFFILPHSLIATSLITAMFTRMSRAAHAEDLRELSRQYRHGLRLLGVAMVPISVGVFVLAPSLTSLLWAENTPRETLATAHVLMALVIGLSPYGIYILSGRIFHAFQDGRTPFRMQLVITAIAGTGSLVAATLPAAATAIGIGLAQTAGQAAAAVLGVIWVRRRLGGVPLGDVARTYRRVLLATAVAVLPTLLVVWAAHRMLLDPWASLVSVTVGGPLLLGCYAMLAHRLGVTEVGEAVAPVARRLGLARLLPARARSGPSGPGGEGPQERDGSTLGLPHGRDGAEDGRDLPRPVASADEVTPAREEYSVHGIEPGRVLGDRYLLQELLARRDDTLDYWSARDVTLDRTVAVTVLSSEGEQAELAESVLDGARRTAGVDDPRLVRVLDVGQEDGLSWIVEEGLVDAESLASLVADGPLPAEEVRRIIGEAASGLETARRRGLHHLFLSPYAVLCTRDGAVKLSGVAVAAALEQTEEISASEASLVDTADLVSLLYTGLTGRWPGEEMEGLREARRLADGSLPAPSEVVAGVPGDLDALCRQVLALDFDPHAGPQTPGELARQLAPWSPEPVRDQPVAAPDAPLQRSG
ncbi:murein biosynthesis integral membrane protein MurJ, partial [Ornithinicoccus halotolerans]|uniref:murein biosynthesis integral membrane protein MurJ n=1 Tax=Ornithinicoccus halotolerans TaxID=1748220 RepID=UPI001297B34B